MIVQLLSDSGREFPVILEETLSNLAGIGDSCHNGGHFSYFLFARGIPVIL